MRNTIVQFDTVIASLIDTAQRAWNNSDLKKFDSLMESDIVVTMEAVTIGGIHFEAQNLKGPEAVIKFMKKYRKKLPLRYQVEYNKKDLAKHMVYRKFFYEIKIWAHFDCTVSAHGKFQEFHISNYKNVHSKKITTLYLLKNMIHHKLNNLFVRKAVVPILEHH